MSSEMTEFMEELRELLLIIAFFSLFFLIPSYYIVENQNEDFIASSYIIEEVDKEIINGKIKKHYYLYTTDDFCISDGDVDYTSPDYNLSAVKDLRIYLILFDSLGNPVSNRYDVINKQEWVGKEVCLPFSVEVSPDVASKVKYAKLLFHSGEKLIGSITVPIHKS